MAINTFMIDFCLVGLREKKKMKIKLTLLHYRSTKKRAKKNRAVMYCHLSQLHERSLTFDVHWSNHTRLFVFSSCDNFLLFLLSTSYHRASRPAHCTVAVTATSTTTIIMLINFSPLDNYYNFDSSLIKDV